MKTCFAELEMRRFAVEKSSFCFLYVSRNIFLALDRFFLNENLEKEKVSLDLTTLVNFRVFRDEIFLKNILAAKNIM